jgi:uncharacterized protein (TIGR03437 family)
MSKRKRIILNSSLILLAIAPIVLYAYETGPDQGYTGAPGDNPTACMNPAAGCHTGSVNKGTGSIKIVASGGTAYVPGGPAQTITVTIADSTEHKYGFELTARADSSPKTQGAGAFTAGTDGYTQVIDCRNAVGYTPYPGSCPAGNTSLQWIEHDASGYYATTNKAPSFSYTFTWTPPATNVGTVTLYAAGNAVVGNLTTTGDNVYTTSLQLSPAAASTNAPAATVAVSDATFIPGGAVTTGSWVAVFGANLAPAGDSRPLNSSTEIVDGILPTKLDGTTVTVNGKPAYLGYISPGQVNIETPDDTAAGPVNVVVNTSNGASPPVTLNLQKYAPGFFPSGQGNYIAAQHANGSSVGGYTGSTPAQPGEVIILWGTGFGPSSPTATPAGEVITAAPPPPGNLAGIAVTIGGVPATIQYAGITISGLAQINVTVPASLANGDQPIVASVSGISTQANAIIAVHN